MLTVLFASGCFAKKTEVQQVKDNSQPAAQQQSQDADQDDTQLEDEANNVLIPTQKADDSSEGVSDEEIDTLVEGLLEDAEQELEDASEEDDALQLDNNSDEINNLMQTYEEGQF